MKFIIMWGRSVLRVSLVLWGIICAPLCFGVAAEPVSGVAQYTADLTYRSDRGEDFPIGSASLLRETESGAYRVRLDFALGRAGMFSAILRPEEKALFVVSYGLSAYVTIPTQGNERSAADLLPSVAAAFMPFGVPALTIREEKREALPTASVDGLPCKRERILYMVTFMGDASDVALVEWNSSNLPFLRVRVDELRSWDAPDSPRGTVLLKNIRSSGLDMGKELFEVPDGYTRYGSALNMLLYALAAQW